MRAYRNRGCRLARRWQVCLLHYVTVKRFQYSIKRIDLSGVDRDGTLEHAKAFAMTSLGATLPFHARRCIG